MFCTNCGCQNRDTAKFCKACGSKLDDADEIIAAPAPTPTPQPAPVITPEPVVIPEPTPEPVVIPEPTPEPVVIPAPTPEPVVIPKPIPEPVVIPEPTPEPAAPSVDAAALLQQAHSLQRGIGGPVNVQEAYALYQQVLAADSQNMDALNNLSQICYTFRFGEEYAFHCASLSAAANNAVGMYWLAVFYLSGFGCQANEGEAAGWFRRSAAAGYIRSAFELADAVSRDEYIFDLTTMATSGNSAAQVALYQFYRYDDTPDEPKALAYLQQAVNQEYPYAIGQYASLLEFGSDTVNEDLPRAKALWEKAAALGDDTALWRMGSFYWHGEKGYPEDYTIAQRYYERVIAEGDLAYGDAASDLGLLLCENHTDDTRAVSLLEAAATEGNTVAAKQLGYIYLEGRYGVTADAAKGIRYYEKAAEDGSDSAMAELGHLYLDGAGGKLPIDTNRGITWMSRAAEAGNGLAALELAEYYYNGQYVQKDEAKSRYFYECAAKADMIDAMLPFGLMNEEGIGGAKLFRAAEYWYQQLVASGADDTGLGQYHLGTLYLYKMGRPQEALAQLLEAAQRGNADAMYYTGCCYVNGWGTAVNLYTGEYWLNMAAQRGNAQAQNDLPIIRQLLQENGNNFSPEPLPPVQADDTAPQAGGKKQHKAVAAGQQASTPKSYQYKDPGMDVKQAVKIIVFTAIFLVLGLALGLVIKAAYPPLNGGIVAAITYAVAALPLSIIRLKGLRANGNKGEIGAAGGYLLGGGSQGNGCAAASAFIVARWLMNWIICLVALLYWLPKSIIALVRNGHNKHIG